MASTLTGKCLCGAVKIEATLTKDSMGACHCSMCRRWAGGPMLTLDAGQEINLSGDANITRFESSEWAIRGFCKSCGTHLFYQMNANGQYFLPAGLLEGADKIKFEYQIFIDEKPGNYDFANETHNMTGEEVFASFTSQENE